MCMAFLSTPTAIIHSCPECFNPELPNPSIYPARSIAEASAQFQNRDPSVVQEMFATVHAAGSSLLALFSSCTTFDSTRLCRLWCRERLAVRVSARAAAMLAHIPSRCVLGCCAASWRGPNLGQIVVRHRGLDVGERHCLSTGARRVRNPQPTQEFPRMRQKAARMRSDGLGTKDKRGRGGDKWAVVGTIGGQSAVAAVRAKLPLARIAFSI